MSPWILIVCDSYLLRLLKPLSPSFCVGGVNVDGIDGSGTFSALSREWFSGRYNHVYLWVPMSVHLPQGSLCHGHQTTNKVYSLTLCIPPIAHHSTNQWTTPTSCGTVVSTLRMLRKAGCTWHKQIPSKGAPGYFLAFIPCNKASPLSAHTHANDDAILFIQRSDLLI